MFKACDIVLQDEEGDGFNTSDEEFERQLEEAAVLEAEAKLEKAKRPKFKKGRGRNAKKRKRTRDHGDPDAEGYEVSTLQ